MRNPVTPITQRGFTALELIIVLIIGFSIIGLSASKMTDMMNASKATRALDSMVNLSIAIKSLSNPGGYGNPSDSIVTTIIDSGVLPKSLKVNGQGADRTLVNQWNKLVEVNVDAGDNKKFNITYHGIPKASCNKLVKDLLGNFIVSVTLNNNTQVANLVDPRATLTDIVTACGIADEINIVLSEL